MTFTDRLKLAKQFEKDVETYLDARKKVLSVVKNGTEHTHPDFVELLRKNDSATSKLIRFAPDGVALCANKTVIHWEAKASNNIEKDAYETYMKYFDMGCQLVIFVRNKLGRVYFSNVQNISFIPSKLIVNKFPENPYFVDEDDWIHPRKSGNKVGGGSGTPYKKIDFGSMTLIPNFNEKIAA